MSIHFDILEEFQERTEALNLEGEASGTPQITYDILKTPTGDWRQDMIGSTDASYPMIAFTHDEEGEREVPEDTTNLYTAMAYPVFVYIVDVDRGDGDGGSTHSRIDHVKNHNTYLGWRQAILIEFLGKTLSRGTTTACDVRYNSRPIVSNREWVSRGGLWVSRQSFDVIVHVPKIQVDLELPAWQE